MALSFAFGGDTGTTYDDLKRRQALAQAMWARGAGSRAPKTAMEGVNSAAQSITGALLAKKLGKQIKGEQDEFGMLFNGALGGLGSQPMGGQASFAQPNPMDEAFPVGQTGAAPVRDSVSVGGKDYDMGQPADMGMFIKQGLVKRGLPEHVADAFVMNFKDESGLNPGINERQPLVPGSRGGFGLAQWTGPRRKALEAFAQQRGLPVDDPNLQMDFLVQELQGPEAKAAQSILGAPDAGSAATAIVNNFLRPAEEHRAARAARYGGVQTASAGGINPMLLSMVSDPRATPEQRSVLQMLVQQQMQASDPMRQLQMQNLQGQIDARNAPQAPQLDVRQLADGRNYYIDPTGQTPPRLVSPDLEVPEGPSSFIVSGAQAAEYGLPDDGKAYQVTVDGNNVQAKAVGGGGVTVNNNTGGPVDRYLYGSDAGLPQGWRLDRETGQASQIPGGPEEIEAQQTAEQKDMRQTQTNRAANIVLQDIDRALEQSGEFGTTGFLGGLLDGVGGTAAHDLQNTLRTVQANIGFDRLQQMREASPTGGALGAVSERELTELQAVLGSVQQSQTKEQLQRNLTRLKSLYAGILEKAAAYPNAADFGFYKPESSDDGWTEVNGVKIRVKK